jgi:ABC-2 type transport system permease protein
MLLILGVEKMYYKMFKISIKKQLAYNWEIFFSSLISIISMFILASFWKTIYENDIEKYIRMLNYAIIAQILGKAYYINAGDKLAGMIRDGSLSIELLKPYNVIIRLFTENFGMVIVKIITCSIPTFLLSLVFFKINIPGILNFTFFLVMIFLSILLLFLIKVLISTICFWIIEAWSLLILSNTIILLFSGKFIPDWMMPELLKKIMNYLPFIWMYQKPIEIYQLRTSNIELVHSSLKVIGMQGFWIFILVCLLTYVWKKSIKMLVVQGG